MAVMLAGANLWFFLVHRPSPPKPDFELGATLASIGVGRAEWDTVPQFDSARKQWLVKGKPVRDLVPLLRTPLGDTSSIAGQPVLVARLSREAGAQDVRRALLSLARQGICNVAIWGGGEAIVSGTSGGMVDIPVHAIVSVGDGEGRRLTCTQRQSAAAASSASR
ncbi:hypothetical protein MTR66_03905 [Novosphingobium sp. 2638]|uniref:Uncharacterized protein n=1 Tax=Novosphingobium beihaiensis TaxID=2930389 RepID=A0ABT0BM98_9SPHN|nr:hypothetical protein [Novosphingobium beihaiensis]